MKTAISYPKHELTKMGTGNTITYEEVQLFLEEVLTNLQSVKSDYGNGNMGHTHLFHTTEAYNLRSVDAYGIVKPYIAQPHPGTALAPVDIDHPPSFWSFFRATLSTAESARQLKIKTKRWQLNHDVLSDTKAMIRECTSDVYYATIKDADNTYITATVRDFIQHFVHRYGTIDDTVLTANVNKASEPLDLVKPIDSYIERMNSCRRVAAAGNEPFLDKTTIRLALDAMKATMQFNKDLSDRSNDIEKHPRQYTNETWTDFQVWLCRIDKVRRKHQTTAEAGYHGQANHAPAASASPDTSPRHTPELLQAFNAFLASQADGKTTDAASSSGKQPFVEQYCHTHGICGHSSNKCTDKGPNHKDEATLKRKLGGLEIKWSVHQRQKRRRRSANTE